MARSTTPKSSLESVNEAYAARVGNLEKADDKDREEAEKAEEGFEHTETALTEEAKFVANPDALRKEVDSEEKFSEDTEDGTLDLGLPEPKKS
jgi:hypothetical protein